MVAMTLGPDAFPEPYPEVPPAVQRVCCDTTMTELHDDACEHEVAVRPLDLAKDPEEWTDHMPETAVAEPTDHDEDGEEL